MPTVLRARGMSTSGKHETGVSARASGVVIGETEFAVFLGDGRRIVVPFACYPRLAHATAAQRQHVEVYSQGKMLHWPDVDEYIEVQHLADWRMPTKVRDAILAH